MSRTFKPSTSLLPLSISAAIGLIAGWVVFLERSGTSELADSGIHPSSQQLGDGRLVSTAESGDPSGFSSIHQSQTQQSQRIDQILESVRQGNQQVEFASIKHLLKSQTGDQVSFRLGRERLGGTVYSIDHLQQGAAVAVDLANGIGRFEWVHRHESTSEAALFFHGEEAALRFDGLAHQAGWPLRETTVASLLGSVPGVGYPPPDLAAASAGGATIASAESGGDPSGFSPIPVDAAVGDGWVEVSPDGYFRYGFSLPTHVEDVPSFDISMNGIDWEEALVVDVWKTYADQEKTSYEAIIAPPLISSVRVLIKETHS